MPINEFRNRIQVRKYVFGQDAIGNNVKSLTEYFDLWTKKENMNGSRLFDNLQIEYSKAFKYTTRYEKTRPIIPIDEIFDYNDNLTYSIQSVTHLEEGKNSFNVMVAYTTGTESNVGEVITGPGEGELIVNEVPQGIINGSNVTFTTEFEFIPESISVTINGLEQKSPEDYLTSGTHTIIFTSSPEIGDQILIDYIKAF